MEFFKIHCRDSFSCHDDIMVIILSVRHTGTKPEEYMDDVKAIFPNSIAAKDKRSVELVFED